jgi:arylsulfatase A
MKGIKGHVDEGGIRVPFFIRWPGHLPEGVLIGEAGRHIDILPTVLELCGIDYSPENPIDGQSLVPLLTGTGSSNGEREIFSIQNNGELRAFPASIRTSRYMYVFDSRQTGHLYDMKKDPGQQKDIAGELPVVGDSLKNILDSWYADVTASGFAPLPVPAGYAESPLTHLPAAESRISGGLEFYGKMGWANDWIIRWNNPDDKATWTIDVANSGTFEILAEFASGQASLQDNIKIVCGNESVQYQLPGEVTAPFIESPDRMVRGEVYERKWKSLSAGEIFLDKGLQEISVQPAVVLNDTTFALKAIYLNMKGR